MLSQLSERACYTDDLVGVDVYMRNVKAFWHAFCRDLCNEFSDKENLFLNDISLIIDESL